MLSARPSTARTSKIPGEVVRPVNEDVNPRRRGAVGRVRGDRSRAQHASTSPPARDGVGDPFAPQGVAADPEPRVPESVRTPVDPGRHAGPEDLSIRA